MSSFTRIGPLELYECAQSYRYKPETFRDFEQAIWKKIQSYAGDYGQSVIEHLTRTASRFGQFMQDTDTYDLSAVNNVSHAFKLHDAGKTLQAASIWNLPEKPTAEIRAARYDHVFLGEDILKITLEDPRFSHLNNHPHLSVIECVMRHHHERIDGRGPIGLKGEELGEILEFVGIIDGADGKMLPRANRERRSVSDVFHDMTGDERYTADKKHAGEYRLELLQRVADFMQSRTGHPVLPRRHAPAQHP